MTDTKSAFLEALRAENESPVLHTTPEIAKAFGLENVPNVKLARVLPEIEKPIEVRIELVLAHKLIDVFFSRKPDTRTREKLKNQGFYWNPESLAWYCKDTVLNRCWLSDTFGATFEQPELKPIEPEVLPPESDNDNEGYTRFRKQVNELIDALKCDPADLMLIAINVLHRKTFN